MKRHWVRPQNKMKKKLSLHSKRVYKESQIIDKRGSADEEKWRNKILSKMKKKNNNNTKASLTLKRAWHGSAQMLAERKWVSVLVAGCQITLSAMLTAIWQQSSAPTKYAQQQRWRKQFSKATIKYNKSQPTIEVEDVPLQLVRERTESYNVLSRGQEWTRDFGTNRCEMRRCALLLYAAWHWQCFDNKRYNIKFTAQTIVVLSYHENDKKDLQFVKKVSAAGFFKSERVKVCVVLWQQCVRFSYN